MSDYRDVTEFGDRWQQFSRGAEQRFLVIAGTGEQARQWARTNGLRLHQWKYIHHPSDLHGADLRDRTLILTGLWGSNPLIACYRDQLDCYLPGWQNSARIYGVNDRMRETQSVTPPDMADPNSTFFVYHGELREKSYVQAMDWASEIIRLGTELTHLQERFCLILDRRAFDFARCLPDPTMLAPFTQRLCELNPWLMGIGYDERLVPGYAQLKTAAGDRVVLHVIHESLLPRERGDRSGFTSREAMEEQLRERFRDLSVRIEINPDQARSIMEQLREAASPLRRTVNQPIASTPEEAFSAFWEAVQDLGRPDLVRPPETLVVSPQFAEHVRRLLEQGRMSAPAPEALRPPGEAETISEMLRGRMAVDAVCVQQRQPEPAVPSDPDYLLSAIAFACDNIISRGSPEMSTLRLLCKKMMEVGQGAAWEIASRILLHVNSTGVMTPAELRFIASETEGAAEAIAQAKASRDGIADQYQGCENE